MSGRKPNRSIQNKSVGAKKTSVRGNASSGDRRGSSSTGGDKADAERSFNGLEAFVRKLPAGKPLTSAEGFDEFNKQWYVCRVPIVVMTFVMAMTNIAIGLLLIAVSVYPLVNYNNIFAALVISVEIIVSFLSGIFAFVNLFCLQRNLVIAYGIMQIVTTLIFATGSVSLTIVYNLDHDPMTETTSTVKVTTVSRALNTPRGTTEEFTGTGSSSVLPVMIVTFIALFVQVVKLVVAFRYRLYLIIKRYALKSVNKSLNEE